MNGECNNHGTCSRCGKTNTEFKSFKTDIDLRPMKKRVRIVNLGYVRKLIIRYVNMLLSTELEVEIKVCQSCVSKMLRSCDTVL